VRAPKAQIGPMGRMHVDGAREVMKKKKRKLAKGKEARRRARAAGLSPASTKVIEDKRKKPEKHKSQWLEDQG
jgi:hypothetical protein